jgi:hypothetical protein
MAAKQLDETSKEGIVAKPGSQTPERKEFPAADGRLACVSSTRTALSIENSG